MRTLLAATFLFALPALTAAQESGSFTLIQGDATIATETFERSGDLLETTLEITNQATLVTRSTLADDATVERMEIEVYGPGGATGDPIQTSAASFDEGAVTLEQPIGTALPGDPQTTEVGAIPYVNPSPSYMEQILRRARAIGGDDVQVMLWIPGQPQGAPTSVSFDNGSATIDLAGVSIEATTDAEGRLLSAEIPAQSVTITRN